MRAVSKHEQHQDSQKSLIGFWIYLMTDCILFACFFAAFAVLRNNTFGGESARELFNLPYVLIETLLLLTSSFVCALMMLAVKNKSRKHAMALLYGVILLGASFLALELLEFRHLLLEDNSWRNNAFLTSFFALVGTHGLHILIGLLWAVVLMALLAKRGITKDAEHKLKLFSIYWHFLDIIWICIFTVVYLRGAM